MNIAMNFLVVIACCFKFCQLPSCNSFTQQLCFTIFVKTPLVKLWPPVHYFTLITTLFTCFSTIASCWSTFTFIAFTHIFYTIRLILCIQQDGKLDNLPGSLGQRRFVFVCRSTTNLAEALYSYWFDNLDFTIEGNLLLLYIIPSTWGSQRMSADASGSSNLP